MKVVKLDSCTLWDISTLDETSERKISTEADILLDLGCIINKYYSVVVYVLFLKNNTTEENISIFYSSSSRGDILGDQMFGITKLRKLRKIRKLDFLGFLLGFSIFEFHPVLEWFLSCRCSRLSLLIMFILRCSTFDFMFS